MALPLSDNELHQARLAADNGWFCTVKPDRWLATLDRLWEKLDAAEAELRSIPSEVRQQYALAARSPGKGRG